MARKSFVANLNAEQRDALNQRIDDGVDTLDELLLWHRGVDGSEFASRSALGRYVQKRRARGRALESLAETVAMPDEGGSNEALDLMLELATLRIKEAKILERLRELGVV